LDSLVPLDQLVPLVERVLLVYKVSKDQSVRMEDQEIPERLVQ